MMPFVFFADCGPSMGLGHIRRSAALAAALARGDADCSFNIDNEHAKNFMDQQLPDMRYGDYSVEALPKNATVVIDSYTLSYDHYDAIRSRARRCILIDDLSDRSLNCDVHLNHNLFAETMDHATIAAPLRLLGPRYFLVDEALPPLRDLDSRDGIIISFGGTDDGRMATHAARAIREIGVNAPLILVASPLCEMHDDAVSMEREYPNVTVEHGAIMAEAMSRCRLYVGAAGHTSLEALSAGLSITIVQTASNQNANVQALLEYGEAAFARLDWPDIAHEAARHYYERSTSRLASILDGKGPLRAAAKIIDAVR